jgi:hypothetical protein
MSVRPELAAASVTQVIASAVQMPGSVSDFDANTTAGAAALNQFSAGVADLFGVSSDEIVIIDISSATIGRRLLAGGAGDAVTVHYQVQVSTTEPGARNWPLEALTHLFLSSAAMTRLLQACPFASCTLLRQEQPPRSKFA